MLKQSKKDPKEAIELSVIKNDSGDDSQSQKGQNATHKSLETVLEISQEKAIVSDDVTDPASSLTQDIEDTENMQNSEQSLQSTKSNKNITRNLRKRFFSKQSLRIVMTTTCTAFSALGIVKLTKNYTREVGRSLKSEETVFFIVVMIALAVLMVYLCYHCAGGCFISFNCMKPDEDVTPLLETRSAILKEDDATEPLFQNVQTKR